MHRRVRRALFRLADLLEEGGEHLATAIRRRAERKRRPRPLCFPDPVWVGLMEMLNESTRKLGAKYAVDLLRNGQSVQWMGFDEARHIGDEIKIRRIAPELYYTQPEERGPGGEGI